MIEMAAKEAIRRLKNWELDGIERDKDHLELVAVIEHALVTAEADLCFAESAAKIVDALRENRSRLETMEEDYQEGLPKRRLADDLLDAIDRYEAEIDEIRFAEAIERSWQ